MTFARLTLMLQLGLVACAVMSASLLLAPNAPWMTAYNHTFAESFWAGGPLPPQAVRHHAFLLGVTAAGVIGWVVTLWFVVAHAWKQRQRWAWRAVAYGVLAWALVDVALCLAFGQLGEALFAVAGSAVLLLPTFLARRYFSAEDD